MHSVYVSIEKNPNIFLPLRLFEHIGSIFGLIDQMGQEFTIIVGHLICIFSKADARWHPIDNPTAHKNRPFLSLW